MTLLLRFITATLFAVLTACGTTSEPLEQAGVKFSSPTDEDAIPLEEKFESKESARKKLGEPVRTKVLTPSDASSCTERWFYTAKANISGLGTIDLLTYVDFDANGKSCASPKP